MHLFLIERKLTLSYYGSQDGSDPNVKGWDIIIYKREHLNILVNLLMASSILNGPPLSLCDLIDLGLNLDLNRDRIGF